MSIDLDSSDKDAGFICKVPERNIFFNFVWATDASAFNGEGSELLSLQVDLFLRFT